MFFVEGELTKESLELLKKEVTTKNKLKTKSGTNASSAGLEMLADANKQAEMRLQLKFKQMEHKKRKLEIKAVETAKSQEIQLAMLAALTKGQGGQS